MPQERGATRNTRQTLVIAAAVVAGLVIGGLFLAPHTPAQQGPPAQPAANQPGRYQLHPTPNDGLAVIDTTIGQVWSKAAAGDAWKDWGSPAKN